MVRQCLFYSCWSVTIVIISINFMLVFLLVIIGSRKCFHYGDFKDYPLKKTYVAETPICYPNSILCFTLGDRKFALGGNVPISQCPLQPSVGMTYGSGQWDAGGSLWGGVPSKMKRQSMTRRKHFTPSAFTLLPTWNVSMRSRDAASMLRPRGDTWEGQGCHAVSGVKKSPGSLMVLLRPGCCSQIFVQETSNVLRLS